MRRDGGSIGKPALGLSRRARILRIRSAQGGPGSGDGETTESLFLKELKRRGISNAAEASTIAELAQQQQQGVPKAPPRLAADYQPPPLLAESQLEKSRALNSEGLEGLIPRAGELVKLGGSFFLAFGPFIAVVSIVFTAAYLLLGEAFVHGGGAVAGPPPYIDPYDLLNEPIVDPMIPFNLP